MSKTITINISNLCHGTDLQWANTSFTGNSVIEFDYIVPDITSKTYDIEAFDSVSIAQIANSLTDYCGNKEYKATITSTTLGVASSS